MTTNLLKWTEYLNQLNESDFLGVNVSSKDVTNLLYT